MFIGILGALLFLVSFVWLIVVALQNKSRKMPAILLLVGFVMFVFGVSTDDTAPAEEASKSEDSSVVVSSVKESDTKEKDSSEKEPVTIEDKVQKIGKKVFNDKLIKTEFVSATNHVNISFNTIGFSVGMDKNAANSDVKEALEKIQALEEIESVTFIGNGELVDEYGNSESEKILTYDFDRETMDKINYDNVVIDNIPDIATDYYQHPALFE